jgi:hypothetical protein
MMTLYAATGTAQQGWAGPLAILAAFATIGALHVFLERRNNRSPTPPAPGPRRVKAQVSAVSDTGDTSADTDWWGRIVTVDGVRMRRFRQVLTTGSSQLPEDEVFDELDEQIDLELEEPNDLDSWLRSNLEAMRYADLVREGMFRWNVSASTMKRRIKAVRGQAA